MEVAAALNMGMLSGDAVVLPSAAAEVGGALCFAVAMRSVSCVARAMRSTFSLAVGRTVLSLTAAMPSCYCLTIESLRGDNGLVDLC